ncbi:MAG: transposase [Euryarchaeota archaeon]|nr:transposase [Euryarchaeota archaeon]
MRTQRIEREQKFCSLIFFVFMDGDRIEHILSWHQVQSNKELKESLKKVKEAGLIPEEEVRLCVIADGARWIWKVAKELYPKAVEVLDYYHLSEHLYKLAEVQYGHDSERAQEWIEATLTRLFSGEAYGVIWGLERMKPRSAEAKSEIDNLIGYLNETLDRVDYN